MVKGQLAGVEEKVAKAREEVVQEYKDKFKDKDDYFEMMRDAVGEYKMAVKKVDSNLDVDYYDKLILSEPQTLVPEDPVGFKNVDPIGTPGVDAEQSTISLAEPLADNPV